MVAVKKFYTENEITEAKSKLANLPDLSKDRLSRGDVLESLKADILQLANEKGYSVADIKSALETMGLSFSEKAIAEVMREKKPKKNTRPSAPRQETKKPESGSPAS